ncbi:MAG: hypothetical protein IGR92_01830 [Leptolyngbyaceae cyanobacterium T60_A2020_046]|nr:hypothetical protein [Leptolyngbyaceae cyanobacterium T60_A2020_046]
MAAESDPPLEIRLFDQASALEAFLADHQDLLQSCIVTLQEVELVQYPAAIEA